MKAIKDDPIKRYVEKESEKEYSPMDPPEAYEPQNVEQVPFEKMDPFLQQLIKEHQEFKKILNDFEDALLKWREDNWIFNNDINKKFKKFFSYADENLPLHNKKEEKLLFPVLHKKLVESGEHNSEDSSYTGINIMEDEHVKAAQASALVLNLLGLGSRLPDMNSKDITFTAAFDQGMSLIETMKLHIFREDNILFPQSMKLFGKDEFDIINQSETI
jgi:hemerythrin-like domain-containing protein